MAIDADRLLPAMRALLLEEITPAIRADRSDAAEYAWFAATLLGRIHADLFLFPAVASGLLADYRNLAQAMADRIADTAARERLETASGLQPVPALDLIRLVIADMLPALDAQREGGDAEPVELARRAVELDRRWRSACNEAMAGGPSASSSIVTAKAETAIEPAVTPVTLTAYLRRTLGWPDAEVTSLQALPGGRSKDTYLLEVANCGDWPASIVMRQDAGRHALKTVVADEYPILERLSRYDVKTPSMLHFEGTLTELGKPFFLMEKLEGSQSGNYYIGLFETDPAKRRRFVLDAAATFARLHRIDPRDVIPDAPDHYRHMLDQVRHYKEQWRQCAGEPSPMITQAYLWLERELQGGIGPASIVHGDLAVHNILVRDSRLTALLDWELVGVGDAAADLAYFRQVAETAVPWADFMDEYVANGGERIDERRLKIYAIWAHIRNAAIGAGGGAAYRADPDAAFELGFMGTATLFMEQQLVPLLPLE